VIRAFGPIVHLHNVSGGVLAGDHLSLDVELASGAHAQVTTTGATRLYRHREGADDSRQELRFSIGAGAMLEYLPDPLIPFAGSRHTQQTSMAIGRDATVFCWEVLAQTFAYERLRVSNAIDICGKPVIREDFLLEPAKRSLRSLARMAGSTHAASFYVMKDGKTSVYWRDLEEELRKIAPANWGISTLATGGIIGRALSDTGRHFGKELAALRNMASLFVTGKIAMPPRKVY
jgi:urease accessory protein